jgi:hypothetical protein
MLECHSLILFSEADIRSLYSLYPETFKCLV